VKRVFVDSGGFFALLVSEDQFHVPARLLFQRANTEHWRLVTTNAVIIETHALLLSRSRDGHANAIEFLDMIASDAYRVERIRKADEEKAIALVRAHQDKDYSLCDALSFTVMERLRIREAIAFDRHFRAYGRFLIL
jgi:predicted nucleic acid-binding protein